MGIGCLFEMGASSSAERQDKYEDNDNDNDKLKYGPCVRNTVLATDVLLLLSGGLITALDATIGPRLIGGTQAGTALLGLIATCCRCKRVLLLATVLLLAVGGFNAYEVVHELRKESASKSWLCLYFSVLLCIVVHTTLVLWISMCQCCYRSSPKDATDLT